MLKLEKKMIPGILLIFAIARPYVGILYYPYILYKLIFIGLIFVLQFHYIKYLNKTIFVICPLYILIMCLSTIWNGMSPMQLLQCITFGMLIFDIYLTTTHYAVEDELGDFFDIVFKILAVYLILSDITAVFVPLGGYYFSGTKFMVVYIHCLLICIWIAKNHIKQPVKLYKEILLCLFVESFLIALIIGCNTGVLIIPALAFLLLLPEKFQNMLANSKMLLFAYAIGNFMLLGMNVLVSNETIYNFITQVLGEGASFRGRLIIYNKIAGIILQKPILGYGYTSDIVYQVVTFGNAQNGMLDTLIQYGIIGWIIWLILFACTCRNVKRTHLSWPFYCFTYVMIAASFIEIPFNLYFYLGIALVMSTQLKENASIK